MKSHTKGLGKWSLALLAASIMWTSCDKENQNNIPDTTASANDGKIDGFDSSDQVYQRNLVAYWNFDDNKTERFSGVNPTSSLNDSYVAGVRGKGINLNDGWIYYGTQIDAFRTANLKSWTVSEWVDILNNGSTPTMVFQISKPNDAWGSINSMLETGQNPATELNKLVIKAVYTDLTGGLQDNLNAPWLPGFISPTLGADKWINIVTTYDYTANNLQIWADGRMVGTTDYQNRGDKYFKAVEPGGVIIGAWPRNVGITPGTDTWQVPMKGKVDEIRVYDTVVGAAHIRALYNLGLAGK